MKYAVKRTQRNHRELNRVFNELYRKTTGIQFSSNGEYLDGHHDYLHHPRVPRVRYPSLQPGYTEVTLEEFKQILNNKTQQMATQQFKTGDKVIITKWHHSSYLTIPQEAIVARVPSGKSSTYILTLSIPYLGDASGWAFKEGEFYLAEEEKKRAQSFGISGKSHQLISMWEDLKELGYRLSISSNPTTGKSLVVNYDHPKDLEQFKELYISDYNNTPADKEIAFSLPDQYKEALDFAAEQLKPEYWAPPKPIEEVLILGSNNIEVTIGKNKIHARDENFKISGLEMLYTNIIGFFGKEISSTYTAYPDYGLRFIRIGCESENNKFSLQEIKQVIDTYNKLNS